MRDGYGCTPPNERNFSRFSRVCRPIRYMSAWYAGPACGLTATRSCGSSTLTYSAVRIVATDADDAWCPPTLMESRFGRTLFALSIMRLASQLTRPSMSLSSCSSPGGSAGAVGGDACSASAVLLARRSTDGARRAKIALERSMDERSPIPSGSKVAEQPSCEVSEAGVK